MAKKFTKDGKELPDQKRVELPIGYRVPETMEEKMMRMIDSKLSRRAEEAGLETIEEANDFDMGEEDGLPLPMSQFELTDMQEENFARDASFMKEKRKSKKTLPKDPPTPPTEKEEVVKDEAKKPE